MLITGLSSFPEDPSRQQYWHQLHERVAAGRRRRLNKLRLDEPAMRQATALYHALDTEHMQIDAIRLRMAFVAHPYSHTDKVTAPADVPAELVATAADRRRAVAARPPLSRLVFRRSRSLALYLTCIYVAHLEFTPGAQVTNEHAINGRRPDRRPQSWAQLAGMTGSGNSRARRARVVRALDQLYAAGLVALSTRTNKYEEFELFKDDGGGDRYLVPGAESSGTLALPPSFFYYGWHLVLEPTEIATYLALREATTRLAPRLRRLSQAGVALPAAVRQSVYGLSDETYESVHELEEFGLIKIHDLMPHRRYGRFSQIVTLSSEQDGQFNPIPYQFSLTDGLGRNAYEVVSKALEDNPTPPRLSEWYVLQRLTG